MPGLYRNFCRYQKNLGSIHAAGGLTVSFI